MIPARHNYNKQTWQHIHHQTRFLYFIKIVILEDVHMVYIGDDKIFISTSLIAPAHRP